MWVVEEIHVRPGKGKSPRESETPQGEARVFSPFHILVKFTGLQLGSLYWDLLDKKSGHSSSEVKESKSVLSSIAPSVTSTMKPTRV